MALSFSKIFKKTDDKQAEEKLVQNPVSNEEASSEEKVKEAKKHGEPGVCCGSCS